MLAYVIFFSYLCRKIYKTFTYEKNRFIFILFDFMHN